METIAIYGKGGIGKSVVATSLSVHYAQNGNKVLHVGCDPKHDSAMRLLKKARKFEQFWTYCGKTPRRWGPRRSDYWPL